MPQGAGIGGWAAGCAPGRLGRRIQSKTERTKSEGGSNKNRKNSNKSNNNIKTGSGTISAGAAVSTMPMASNKQIQHTNKVHWKFSQHRLHFTH
jgi:hypothetical protein